MAAAGAADARKLVEAAIAYYRAKPWRAVGSERAIVLEVPTEPLPVYASVLGSGGGECGLALWRGEGAASLAEAAETQPTARAPGIESIDLVTVSFQRIAEISGEFRKLLSDSGIQFRRDDPAPAFIVKRPGRQMRPPNATERKTLLFALNAVATAHARAELRDVDGGLSRLILKVTGSAKNPTVEVSTGVPAAAPRSLPTGLSAVPEEMREWPRREETWVVGWPEIPTGVAGDDRAVSVLVVADRGAGRVVAMQLLLGRDPGEAANELLSVFAGKNTESQRALPRSMVFLDQQLFDAVAPSLTAVDLRCSTAASDPLVDDILESFVERLQARKTERDDADAPAPAPDDLEAWKKADWELMDLLAAEAERRRWWSKEALAAYFGDLTEAPRLLEDHFDLLVTGAFGEWLCVDYRPKKRGATLLETVLEAPLPEAIRRVAEGHRAAVPSIWRVDSVVPGETITMTDVVSGSRRTIHDRKLSTCVQPGMGLPCRVVAAGNFFLPTIYGPPLSAIQFPRALEHLERKGLVLSTDGLRRRPELLGRLWLWFEREGAAIASSAELRTTDGDPLELQRAVFEIEDPASVRAAFLARSDIEPDPEQDVYVWSRENPKQRAPLGSGTILGRFQILGDRLIVEVDSRQRLAAARSWLSAISGVRFETVRPLPLDDDAALTLDDRLPDAEPIAITEELAAGLQEHLDAYYSRWLDDSIPALGGKSPRQAVSTEEGRRAVRRLILSMPDPGGIPGFHPPREKLLRALGLEGGAATE